MSERKYILAEIDAMRDAIGKTLPQPIYEHSCRPGEWSKPTEYSISSIRSFNATVEDRLRTALVAGLGPEDFKVSATETA